MDPTAHRLRLAKQQLETKLLKLLRSKQCARDAKEELEAAKREFQEELARSQRRPELHSTSTPS